MPALRNTKHEAFARQLIEGQKRGWTQARSYQEAGYQAGIDAAEACAARLLGNDKNGIRQRVAELMAGGAKRAEVTVASLLAELEQARAAAQDDGQFSAAVQAIAGKARLAGLDREGGDGSGSQFSRCESIDDIMRVLLAEQSAAEVLAELAAFSAQVEAYAASHAVVISPEPAWPRPDEAALALSYLRPKRFRR